MIRFLFFLAPDDGGANTAVAAPPAAESMPSAAEVEADDLSFEPPDIDAALKGTQPKEEKPPEPKPEEKKPEAKKPEPKPGEKMAGDKGGEPPAKQLREQLERTKAELAEIRAKAEQPHPRVSELETLKAELEKERESLRQEVEKTRRELEIRDPLASAKIREADEAFNKDYQRILEYMPELGSHYEGLMIEFSKLPRGQQGYGDGLAAFEQKVEDLVGARKFSGAMDAIRKGYDFVQKRGQLVADLKGNAARMAQEERTKQWTQHHGEVSEALGKALEVPDDLEDTDPWSPVLYIKKAVGQMPEAERGKLAEAVDMFTRKVFAGAKPRTAADFPGMTDAQIQAVLAEEAEWHKKARPMAVARMKQGLMALAMMRPLVVELAKLRERVKKEAEAAPPDPTNPGARKEATDDDEDLANFTPPKIRL